MNKPSFETRDGSTPIEAVCACPRCGTGTLTISNRPGPRLLLGRAVLWMNCGHCGLFQTAGRPEATAG
jgi:hypothetical protein